MKIKRLSEGVINLIAAGEVIERPASVVKELVENSIDAGANKIDVWLEDAGKNLIVIADNGLGMSREDLLLSVDRHATSKLNSQDLINILSFGFRGEALASIAAISRLTITSCDNDSSSGWKLSINNDSTKDIIPASCPKGTKIEIRDLFFATPARLKFLKSDKVELAFCLDIIRKLAISYPSISFTCWHNQKQVLDFKAQNCLTNNDSLHARISEAISSEFVSSSIAVNDIYDNFKISGFVGLPTFHRNSSSDQYFFVNGRPIKDKLLSIVTKIAYQDFITSGRYPALALMLEIDPYFIDINVHPCKTEIRFRDETQLRKDLLTSLHKALCSAGHKAADMSDKLQNYAKVNIQPGNPSINYGYNSPQAFYSNNLPRNEHANLHDKLHDKTTNNYQSSIFSRSEIAPQVKPTYQNTKTSIEQKVYPLGASCAQLHKTYIVSQTEDSIIITDQHAAHERIVYEKLKEEMKEGKVITQGLLVPIIVKIADPLRLTLLEKHLEELKDLGLNFKIINDHSVALLSVPKIFTDNNLEQLVNDLLDDLVNMGSANASTKLTEKIVETFACHHSIRAGRQLNIEEMNDILRAMENTPHAGQCNHGRPTYVELKLKDIEKLFGRK
ncbi:MAG: DNA mismatch repair endonuclease MutL [Rickettsiaceae bacterium]|nr:DNA mismatch repair endonuclease MutL [Rickettsiaceae bacterium]